MTTILRDRNTRTASPNQLHGSPASNGRAIGRARIVRSPADGARVQPGEIIVCATLIPAWTPQMSQAAGIVAETGGPLSSAATVAREHGIPAVVAVRHATTKLHDGQPVELDGATGVVTQLG